MDMENMSKEQQFYRGETILGVRRYISSTINALKLTYFPKTNDNMNTTNSKSPYRMPTVVVDTPFLIA